MDVGNVTYNTSLRLFLQQLAYEYAKRGASMALAARRERALETVSAKARELGAPDVLVIAADISNPSEANRVVQATIGRFGQRNRQLSLLHRMP